MVNSFLLYLQLTVKIFQFLRLSTKFFAVLRLSVNRGPWHAFRVTLVLPFVTARRSNRIGLEGRRKRHTGTGREVSSLQFRECVFFQSFFLSFSIMIVISFY